MRRRKKNEREALLDELEQGGQPEGAFCKRNGISEASLRRWRRERYEPEGGTFLPVAVRTAEPLGEMPCRIVVGGIVAIECVSTPIYLFRFSPI